MRSGMKSSLPRSPSCIYLALVVVWRSLEGPEGWPHCRCWHTWEHAALSLPSLGCLAMRGRHKARCGEEQSHASWARAQLGPTLSSILAPHVGGRRGDWGAGGELVFGGGTVVEDGWCYMGLVLPPPVCAPHLCPCELPFSSKRGSDLLLVSAICDNLCQWHGDY